MEELIVTMEQGVMPYVGGFSADEQCEILRPYMLYRRISRANQKSGGNVTIAELIKKISHGHEAPPDSCAFLRIRGYVWKKFLSTQN